MKPTNCRSTNISGAYFLRTPILLMMLFTGNLMAHEPLFMMSHEAPGKGAFDIHTQFSSNTQEKENELELEFSFGLTRDFAVRLGIPIENHKDEESGRRISAMSDPFFNIKWRFWDRDLPGKKYAIAWSLKSTLPVGDSGNNVAGSIYPVVESGFSTGMESLKFYYFFDVRYRYFTPRPGKPGDRVFFDFAPGWRPHVGKLEEIDVVFFLEFNYMHIKRREMPVAANRINDFVHITEQGNPAISFPLDDSYRLNGDYSIRAELPGDTEVVFNSTGVLTAQIPVGENIFLNEQKTLFAEFRVNDYYVVNERGTFRYKPAKTRDRVNPNTGGDVLFISPDVLISTSNRLMFRFGIQIPVWKNLRRLEEVGTTIKFSIESRF